MQTSKLGGESVALHTAEAVNPARPCGPSVVTICTAVPSCAMVSRKICGDISTGFKSVSIGRILLVKNPLHLLEVRDRKIRDAFPVLSSPFRSFRRQNVQRMSRR